MPTFVAPLMFLMWIGLWLVSFYILLRFLRAFERGVRAHELIADSLANSSRGPS